MLADKEIADGVFGLYSQSHMSSGSGFERTARQEENCQSLKSFFEGEANGTIGRHWFEGPCEERFHFLNRHREPFRAFVVEMRAQVMASTAMSSAEILEAATLVLVQVDYVLTRLPHRVMRSFCEATVLDHWTEETIALIEIVFRDGLNYYELSDYKLDWLCGLFGIDPLLLEPRAENTKREPWSPFQDEKDLGYQVVEASAAAQVALSKLIQGIIEGDQAFPLPSGRDWSEALMFVSLGQLFLHARGEWTPELHEAAVLRFHQGGIGTPMIGYDFQRWRLGHPVHDHTFGIHKHDFGACDDHPMFCDLENYSDEVLHVAERNCKRELEKYADDSAGGGVIDDFPFLSGAHKFVGFDWLLLAIRGAERHRDDPTEWSTLACRVLDRTADYRPEETPEACAVELESFSQSIIRSFERRCRLRPNPFLLACQPDASERCRQTLRKLLLEARTMETVHLSMRLLSSQEGVESNFAMPDKPFAEGDHPEDGLIDGAFWGEQLAEFDVEMVEQVRRKLWEELKGDYSGFELVTDALLGRGVEEIESQVTSADKGAIRALGLLPLSSDEGERVCQVMRRYQMIDMIAVKAGEKKSAAGFEVTAACACGLTHLARSAGFAASSELHCAVEQILMGPQDWNSEAEIEISAGVLRLDFKNGKARVTLEQDGKVKTAIPAAVKATAGYKEMNAQVKLRNGAKNRMISRLEEWMVSGERCSGRVLSETFLKLDMGLEISCIVFVTPDGVSGLLEPTTLTLVTLGGERLPVAELAIAVAHPAELELVGDREAWRARVSDLGLSSAIDQFDRKIYLPAQERSDDDRLLDYAVELPAAKTRAALLKRGWRTDTQRPHRQFVSRDIGLLWEQKATRYSATDPFEFEYVAFLSYRRDAIPKLLPMKEVPVVGYSEAIRDVESVLSEVDEGALESFRAAGEVARIRELRRKEMPDGDKPILL